MDMIHLTIDKMAVQVEKGSTILDAAKKLGIEAFHERICCIHRTFM